MEFLGQRRFAGVGVGDDGKCAAFLDVVENIGRKGRGGGRGTGAGGVRI